MPSEPPTSSVSKLLSHPDRTLARHLQGCDEASRLALSFKYVSAAFYPKPLLEQMRHLLVYFHDFGKGTDFFQHYIIEATRKEGTATFLDEHATYLSEFAATKGRPIGEMLRRDEYLKNHAKLGAYMVQSVFQHEDPLLGIILLKVIRRHHGHLTNFAESAKKSPQILLEEATDVPELEKQRAHFNESEYRAILTEVGLDFDLNKWGSIQEYFTDEWEISELKERLADANDLCYFFLQHYLFSLLLYADKGDMMFEREADKSLFIKPNRLLPPDLVDRFKRNKFADRKPGKIDRLREEAYQHVVANALAHGHESFFSLTLPTGLGKTFAAYRVAIALQHQVQRETGQTPRIIYCLPFTSIIDQNAQILEDMVAHYNAEGGTDVDQSWLTTHHYLSSFNDNYDGEEYRKDEAEYMTTSWEQEVVVTTFVQLLESIFTNRNKALRKFHNLTNAVLILDEVQNIPPKYFVAVEAVFRKLAEYFGTKFVFVTATQPFLFANPDDVLELTDPRPYSERTKPKADSRTKYYFDQLTRIQLDQTILKANDYQPLELTEWLAIFQKDIDSQPDKSFLIINNTIAQARAVFQILYKGKRPDAVFVYLSSSLLPVIRREKIDLIKATIAANNKARELGNPVKQLIVVSTQVVEAGVDIDLDVVYRDFAPIDSLNQSAGRCNRNNNNERGVVKLFHAGKAQHIYDLILRDITKRVLDTYPAIIDEKDLYQLNLDYAAEVQKKISENADASNRLLEAMKGLNLEDVARNFKLIEEDNRSYNVFIPYCDEAASTWREYVELIKNYNGFKLKRAIKKLMPRLLQYVTRFPKKHYEPPKGKEENFIIYEPNWKDSYQLDTGFILPANDNSTIFG
jgi:CRISPR-associated endonuclease/helicase Cas3